MEEWKELLHASPFYFFICYQFKIVHRHVKNVKSVFFFFWFYNQVGAFRFSFRRKNMFNFSSCAQWLDCAYLICNCSSCCFSFFWDICRHNRIESMKHAFCVNHLITFFVFTNLTESPRLVVQRNIVYHVAFYVKCA